jgi:hypothetical protein
MWHSWLLRPLIALALSAAPTAAAAQQTVNFASLDGKTTLTAHLSRPYRGRAAGLDHARAAAGAERRSRCLDFVQVVESSAGKQLTGGPR